MSLNERLSEGLALVGTLDPVAVVDTELFTDWVDVSEFKKVLCIALLGGWAAETIDVVLYQATDGSGTGAKTLKAATQLAAHATNNDNTQLMIEADNTDLDVANSFTHVRAGIVSGSTSGGTGALLILGGHAYNGPASAQNLASVQEIATA